MSENRLANAAMILFGIIAVVLILREFQTFLRPLTIAYLFTLVIVPFIERYQKRMWVFWMTLAVIILLLAGGVTLVSFLIKNEVSDISLYEQRVEQAVRNIEDLAAMVSFGSYRLDLESLVDTDRASALLKGTFSRAFPLAGRMVSELFFAILFLIFLIPSHRHLVNRLHRKLDRSEKARFRNALLEIEQSIRTYLMTKSLVSAGTAIVSMIFLWLFGSDIILILGLLVFILNFIPNIGSIGAVAIALFVYFMTHGITLNILWLGLLLTAVQMVFGNYIEPKVAGKQLNLSPVVILLSLFIWYWIWGILGMMLAIPLTSIIRIILANVDETKDASKYLS